MLHHSKGIILRTVQYGDTSLIVTAYTELFGLQTYMVKGGRATTKKGASRANLFQPGNILDMVVYHNELKQMQLIKECSWFVIYEQINRDVLKNCVALFMMELLSKSIRQPESNAGLYQFIEDYLLILDAADAAVTANIPIHFSWHLTVRLGFGIEGNYSESKKILDLQDGRFCDHIPGHGNYIEGQLAETVSDFLGIENPVSIYRIKLNKHIRQQLLKAAEQFFAFHDSDFGSLKTLPVLEAVFS